MKVTTFGSCRQHSIKNNFELTSIQETLTYPHFTKEIIQAIEFCKGISKITPDETKICFRSGILNKTILNVEDYSEDFNNTDFFVIEIASRNTYKYQEKYVHHILTHSGHNFNDIENIIKKEQSDSEIEEDLIRIRELLYPKPFLVVCNICTFKEGTRYKLNLLLKDLTNKLDIPFLDPSSKLSEYDPHSIYDMKMEFLHHFTDMGHYLIGLEYAKIIDYYYKKYLDEKDKLYTQIYYVDKERIRLHSSHGFGDFIKGSMFLFEHSKKNGYVYKIDFSHHHLSKFLYCKSYKNIEETQNTAYAFWNGGSSGTGHGDQDNYLKYKNVFTNMGSEKNITDEIKTFIIENVLIPRIEFKNQLNILKNTLNIKNYNYNIVHVRTGDKYIVSKEEDNIYIHNQLQLIITTLITNNVNIDNTVFITDNKSLTTLIKQLGLKTGSEEKGHIGNIVSIKEVYDTMLEFFLMTTAKHIYQFSVYDWGSGFSTIVNLLFDIPITTYKIS